MNVHVDPASQQQSQLTMDICNSVMFNGEGYLNLFTITKGGREQPHCIKRVAMDLAVQEFKGQYQLSARCWSESFDGARPVGSWCWGESDADWHVVEPRKCLPHRAHEKGEFVS